MICVYFSLLNPRSAGFVATRGQWKQAACNMQHHGGIQRFIRIYLSSWRVDLSMVWRSSHPFSYLWLTSMIASGNKDTCARIQHRISDEKNASQTSLGRLKKLRSPGETGRELDWSRNIPVVRWFSSEGAIFLKNTPVSLWSLRISQLTFRLCVGMINAPWHSFHRSNEGHGYFLLDSKISSNLSRT